MGSERFTEETLDSLFTHWERDSYQKYHFKAYPQFKWNRTNIDCLSVEEQKKMLSFCIDTNKEGQSGGLYYVSALECGLSAREVMAVAGKNVALLVAKDISNTER